MTSEQIKSLTTPDEFASEARLFLRLLDMVQEIAYQLALVNEANERADQERKADDKLRHAALINTLGGLTLPCPEYGTGPDGIGTADMP